VLSRVTAMTTRARMSAPPKEDALAFGIPSVPAEHLRYPPPDLPRDPDELHEISRDLAVILQAEAREPVAADLLHACLARPDPIVRVAAAAASFEITVDPRYVIEVLAKATSDVPYRCCSKRFGTGGTSRRC
jgi:hypothetical protein